jgi:hypothetical protein
MGKIEVELSWMMFDDGSMSPLTDTTYTLLNAAFYVQVPGQTWLEAGENASSSSMIEHTKVIVIVSKGYYTQHVYKVARAPG